MTDAAAMRFGTTEISSRATLYDKGILAAGRRGFRRVVRHVPDRGRQNEIRYALRPNAGYLSHRR